VGVNQNISVTRFKRGKFLAKCYALTGLVATAFHGRVKMTSYV